MFGLNNLSPSPGARQLARRVGRGLNSGGSMCGRGNAGQNSRSGPGPCTGFAGGQTPLWRRFPKLALQKNTFRPQLETVSLEQLQHLLLMGRVKPTAEGVVEMGPVFEQVGASCRQGVQGVRMICEGDGRWFDHRLIVLAGAFSPEAVERIEQLGGLAVAVYMSHPTFRQHLRNPTDTTGRFEPPMNYSSRCLYSQYEHRGYLHPVIAERFQQLAPQYYSRFIHVPPQQPIRLPSLEV